MQECEELLSHAQKTAQIVIQKLSALSFKLALAESCTAGLVSSLLAEVSGASKALWGSFVCYTKEAKVSMLGLDSASLDRNGLVSEVTARQMAVGALKKSGADIAASVTGLAGPQGDGSGVPLGTVWAAAVMNNAETFAKRYDFTGERNTIRLRAAIAVLEIILEIINLKGD